MKQFALLVIFTISIYIYSFSKDNSTTLAGTQPSSAAILTEDIHPGNFTFFIHNLNADSRPAERYNSSCSLYENKQLWAKSHYPIVRLLKPSIYHLTIISIL